MQESLFGKSITDLKVMTAELGLPGFTAKQIADWLYKKDITEIDGMTNISLKNKELLKTKFTIGLSEPSEVQESVDGSRKYLFRTHNDKHIEAVYIPEKDRNTLCISSQAGCKMACEFCMTGKQGFQGHLTAGEIINQVRSIPESQKITNIVYMGMGEPLDNTDEVLKSLDILTSDWGFAMSPRRITLSTIGVFPGLKRFLDESECHLAISLHSPFDEERRFLMPAQKTQPIVRSIELVRKYNWYGQRRFSVEYILFDGVNDSFKHAEALCNLLRGIRARVNLIRYHSIPGVDLKGSSEEKIHRFQEIIESRGLTTTVRKSRGEDILAACGMLSTKRMGN